LLRKYFSLLHGKQSDFRLSVYTSEPEKQVNREPVYKLAVEQAFREEANFGATRTFTPSHTGLIIRHWRCGDSASSKPRQFDP
jgi:hypothetical protein